MLASLATVINTLIFIGLMGGTFHGLSNAGRHQGARIGDHALPEALIVHVRSQTCPLCVVSLLLSVKVHIRIVCLVVR